MPEEGGSGAETNDAAASSDSYLWNSPGHLIRRCQQMAVEAFFKEIGEEGLTPQQFAVLHTISLNAGLSQTALVALSGIDRSTLGEMIHRMIKRGWLRRRRAKSDLRANALTISEAGAAVLDEALPKVERAQERILDPLPEELRPVFLRCLTILANLREQAR